MELWFLYLEEYVKHCWAYLFSEVSVMQCAVVYTIFKERDVQSQPGHQKKLISTREVYESTTYSKCGKVLCCWAVGLLQWLVFCQLFKLQTPHFNDQTNWNFTGINPFPIKWRTFIWIRITLSSKLTFVSLFVWSI